MTVATVGAGAEVELVGKREVSPKERAHLFVEAVEKVNPRINVSQQK